METLNARRKKWDSKKLAITVTAAMATWRFIFLFLAVCALEIWSNKSGLLHFDPDTILLNLFLSLIAAIQGSIILIAQNQADVKRDAILQKLLQLEKQQLKHLKEENKHEIL